MKVRYKRPHGTTSRLVQHTVRDRTDRVSDDFGFASAVAGFGMLLRHSEYGGSISCSQVMALAEDGLGDDPGGYRHGFLEMVQAYARLADRYDGDAGDRRGERS